jgi:uncharacterized protein
MRPARALTQGAAHIRFVILPALWLALFAYAGRPLVIAARAEGAPAIAAWSFILFSSLLPLLPLLVRGKKSAMHWIGYATLALFSILLTVVAAGDFFRLGYWIIVRAPLNARIFSFSLIGVAGALSFVGLVQARCPRVRRVDVAIDNLPEGLDGYTIAQWSDVHVGPTIKRRFVANLVEKTNALGADAIVITGDLVDGPLEELRDQVTPLRDLEARDGVYFVTGNHEYYWRAADWVKEIARLGITFLKNQHRVIERGGAKLVIAGITDPAGRDTHKPDAYAALAGTPRDAVKVLLSHRPQTAAIASRLGVHLQLSGHTHGGQFFPFNYLIRFFQPVVAGLHRAGSMWLYVSRGTGYWGPPSRLGVHGEITLLRFVAPPHVAPPPSAA